MTLPTSGPLTFSDIQTEFGGTNPIALNEYYAGGGLVPAGTSGTYGAVPSSGQISVQNFYGTTAFTPVYIEEVFSTYLYTGNGSTQTINNGIDLAGKGGLVWIKRRDATSAHTLYDTVRGATNFLRSESTDEQSTSASTLTSFNANGFSIGSDGSNFGVNQSGELAVSWTFREQPKFFDIVTYTGNGVTTGRAIAHSLGSNVGALFVKCTSNPSDWPMWHNTFTGLQGMYLNTADSKTFNTFESKFGNGTTVVPPTSTVFTVGVDNNASGRTYVAYLFAHNAGGFGLTGTDNVISCGSYTGNGSTTGPEINLGYEPQWLLIKNVTGGASMDWWLFDSMRGMTVFGGIDADLRPNSSQAEERAVSYVNPNATGFTTGGATALNQVQTYIYIAIRRGPMKVPTSGTSVYNAIARTGTGTVANITGVGFPPDLLIDTQRAKTGDDRTFAFDRLRGPLLNLVTNETVAEVSTVQSVTSFGMDGVALDGSGRVNANTQNYINWFFKRAPSFFDEVCYTGTGSLRTVSHNLGAVPELLIVKRRDTAEDWNVYSAATGNAAYLRLNTTAAVGTAGADALWGSTTPTSSVFTVKTSGGTNASGGTFVAYLFATCAGVSKVGSYTGTGATQTIDCGFTGGARFVLIKRTDSTGDWYVWDSARGIVAGNDPYLLLNSTAAEVTNTNYVDTTAVGFQVTAAAPAGLNANGGTYIFLAIA